MPYLKKVNINNHDYYYLFHTVRDGKKYKKLSKYLGKEIPKNIEKIKDEFSKEIHQQPSEESTRPKHNVVAILQDLQEKHGYLDKEHMIELGKKLDIPAVDIYGVATFYSMFKLKPQGKYIISLCTDTA
jgi:NADH:ubiquinone oxidoreductase subunit E